MAGRVTVGERPGGGNGWVILPDFRYADGISMSASFYGDSNTWFDQSRKSAILHGRYGSFLLDAQDRSAAM